MAVVLILFFLAFTGCISAHDGREVWISRNRDGDEYCLQSGTNGNCETRTCPRATPTAGYDGVCLNDTFLRDEYCPPYMQAHYYLSTHDKNLEIFVIIDDGFLMVFNNQTGNYESGRIANDNGLNGNIETISEDTGCNVTSVSVMRSSRQTIKLNSSGFNIHINDGVIKIQVNGVNLAYPREDYSGEIFRFYFTCVENSKLDCIAFKMNGTANLCKEKFGHPLSNIACHNYESSATFTQTTGTPGLSTLTTQITTRTTGILDNPVIKNIFIGLGCGIGVLLCLILILICSTCLMVVKYKNSTNNLANIVCSSTPEAKKEQMIDMNCNSSYAVIQKESERSSECQNYSNIVF